MTSRTNVIRRFVLASISSRNSEVCRRRLQGPSLYCFYQSRHTDMSNSYKLDFKDDFNNPEVADRVLIVLEILAAHPEDDIRNLKVPFKDADEMQPYPRPRLNPSMVEIDLKETSQEEEEAKRSIGLSRNDKSGLPAKKRRVDLQEDDSGLASSDSSFCETLITSPSPTQTHFIMSETKLHVHSLLLSHHSQFFRSLFSTSGMKETREKEVKVQVRQGQGQLFKKLIQCVYDPETINKLRLKDLVSIVELSDQYCCDLVMGKCVEKLNRLEITGTETCNEVMEITHLMPETFQAKTKATLRKCRYYLLKTFSPLEKSLANNSSFSQFQNLNFHSLEELLSSSDLIVQSENSVVSCVIRWCETNNSTPEMVQKLLEIIHFDHLTANFLHDVITRNHPVLSQAPDFKEWYLNTLTFHSFPKKRKQSSSNLSPARRTQSLNVKEFELKYSHNDTFKGKVYKVYTGEHDFDLCDGYHFKFEFYFREDCRVFMRLIIPNLRADEVFFEIKLKLRLYINVKGCKTVFFMDRNILYKKKSDMYELFESEQMSETEMQEGISKGFKVAYSVPGNSVL